MKNLKTLILEQLKGQLDQQLAQAKIAYESSHKYVTDTELKSEGKYDTRGIEAGYLAGAQRKRVQELESELALLDEITLDHRPDKVSVGSLVHLELNSDIKVYFISSTSGGKILKIEGQTVLVISAFSPIGQEVIGLEKEDAFEVATKSGSREYKVINII